MTAILVWPEPPGAGPIGDGRFALENHRPSSVEQLREVVASRAATGLAIYPQGGRTSLDFGGTPRTPGVAIDLQGLDRVIDYPAADMTITVEAGITLGKLSETLAGQNQRLLIDAPNPDLASLGGIFATNTCGPRRFGNGRPRDQILGVSFVNGQGELLKGGGRVVKNVAGYDFPRLLTGSMGTLGVIVQMTLKVRPRPESSAISWFRLPSIEAAALALETLNTSSTRPVAVELLNPTASLEIGGPLGLPSGGWTLAVGFEDNATSVHWQVDRLRVERNGLPLEVLRDQAALPLWESLNGYQAANSNRVTLVANIRPSEVAPFASRFDPEQWAIQAHAGNGIVRALARTDRGLDDLAREIHRHRALAVGVGGNLMLSSCPADWKEPLKVWGEPRADWAICERLKAALDPLGVMNPGRFVGKI